LLSRINTTSPLSVVPISTQFPSAQSDARTHRILGEGSVLADSLVVDDLSIVRHLQEEVSAAERDLVVTERNAAGGIDGEVRSYRVFG
jgi:hypothetical protein